METFESVPRIVHTGPGRGLVFYALALVMACSSATEPGPPPVLLVTNGTCSTGECEPQEIRGYPDDQPTTPGGNWSFLVGTVVGESACLTFPAADTFRVGSVDYPWTPGKALSLGSIPPGALALQTSPSTDSFVPGTESGWAITLPGGTTVAPAPPCTLNGNDPAG
jgi:hypothetical protein